MWEKMAHMAIDSVRMGLYFWGMNCGWEEAWKSVPARGEGQKWMGWMAEGREVAVNNDLTETMDNMDLT